jgi:hypothetical protein
VARLTAEVGPVPFRLAETPLFLPESLRIELDRSSRELAAQLAAPDRMVRLKAAVPAHVDAPNLDALPACATFDFAITRGDDGQLHGRIVELQAFPSIYAFTWIQARLLSELLAEVPGLPAGLHPFFSCEDSAAGPLGSGGWEAARAMLVRTILGGNDPEEVVLLDLDPPSQKTVPDFVATKKLVGIDAVCPSEVVREGRRLLRRKDGRLVPIRRVYNRIVFDELELKQFPLPWSYTEPLDVTWCAHPNWYWLWSKYSLPLLDHPAIPHAAYLSDLKEWPDDLDQYVLKPLFSFAGTGVKVDVTRGDLDAIPADRRHGYLLQRKITYARDLRMPDGNGVAAELRVLCLLDPLDGKLRPTWNLVRLSRGKMCGVDHNRDLTWVGSSVALWTP